MEKFPKNMAAPLLLLPLIFLSNLADPVQCRGMGELGHVELNLPPAICYKPGPPGCFGKTCWCCVAGHDNPCFRTKDDCKKACHRN
ncbi:hypothetical protein PVAP13_1NG122500 [Panicum virgatum]|uniref:Meg domain-containing protein n=1 Tax=Panicum virgatum TaxID=38727 RepID=A0A8T0WXK1_PANVG|nr:hypothetical protein PVAP13_1NG122500 [Panicum virgatum]